MAGNEEIIRLILETKGADGLKELERESKAARKSLDELGTAADSVAKKSGNSGTAIRDVSRGLQDLQSGGLLGISNNVESIAMSLGAGSGLAGAATLALAGLIALKPAIDAFFKSLGESGTATEAEAMAKLEEATHKTAEETKKLADYKKEQASAQKMLNSVSKADSEQAAAVEELFQGRGEKIRGGIAGALQASGRGEKMTAEEQAAASDETVNRTVESARMNASRSGQIFTPELEAEARGRALTNQQAARDAAQARVIR